MAAVEFPTGTVTLVFTDIQGSSTLWDRNGNAFLQVLDSHNQIMRAAAERLRGYEVKTEGDAFFLSFENAADAVVFAVEVQQALQQFPWSNLLPNVEELRVRIGMHTGEPLVGRHPAGMPDYFGPVVNRAARVGSAGHGGQVLVSEATRAEAWAELPLEISLADMGNHRLKGVGEERLWQVRAPGLQTDFPILRTFNPERHNLPLPPTPFIGRQNEIQDWSDFLRQPAIRLLTILGPGGMGKTRVALQLAELLSEEYGDGVWWIDLQEARTGDEIIQRVAFQLRLQLQPQSPALEQLAAFLSERELLLVLDNTEQIPDAGRVLDSLLKSGPGVRCIVTSRRSLDLLAERLVELLPLPTSDAETLFVESARMRNAEFGVAAENRTDIAELCRQLEGVPLAIELAASRILSMSPREMLNRLGERFRLLQTRSGDLPPRQRALRTAIDWSYELLTEEDQSVFAQLALFQGGFSMTAAENVCDASDVFESVLELRRHSLLRVETQPQSQETRYFALESVRAYMEEKLGELPDGGRDLRARHAAFFHRFAGDRIQRVGTLAESNAMDELGAETGNLRAALQWAAANDQPEHAAHIGPALYRVLFQRGFWSDARESLELAREAARRLGARGREVLACVEYYQSNLALHMGNREEAGRLAESSLAARRELGDRRGAAEVLCVLSVLTSRADPERGESLLREALEMLQETDHAQRGLVFHNLARVAGFRRRPEEARELYERALDHHRSIKDFRGEARTLSALGGLIHTQGDHSAAAQLYHQSLAIRRRLQDREGIAILLNNLGELAEQDNPEKSVALFVHSERMFRHLQSEYAPVPAAGLDRIRQVVGHQELARLRGVVPTSWEAILESESADAAPTAQK